MEYTSIETEQELLGGLIWANACILDIDMEVDDFAFETHRKIFRGMLTAFTEKQNFTVADLEQYEHQQGYVQSLADCCILPIPENIVAYATHLKELTRKCTISRALSDALAGLPSQTSDEAMSRLMAALADGFDTATLKTGEQVFTEIIEDLELPPTRYPTGLQELDQAMGGGLYQGFTYGLAGAEKAGKTTFAHTISHNLSESGCAHLYVALEMGSKQIEQRNLARKMGVNSLKFINNPGEIKNRIHGVSPNRHTVYLDMPGADLPSILHQVGVARLKYGIKGFIVDYWQLVEGQESRESEERHLRRVAQSISNFARRQGLWCILLAQMNQEGKLFGGNGLRKACDQLYFIETVEGIEDVRWLRMDASRYTPKSDVGGPSCPAFVLNKKTGPYIEQRHGEPLITCGTEQI